MGKNTILVVEDEEFLGRVLVDNLATEGFEVRVATDGEQALEEIKKESPALILLDLLLPKKDGFTVLEKVKGNTDLKMIPVIVLSNLGGDEDIKRALSLGADDYFVKSQHPIVEVVEKVKDVMHGR
ncbi:MAG TPA: response regulator [Candidatus Paceibacterota bacterium]